MADDYPPILDTAQVAQLLAMSTQEVTRGAREGWLPAYRVGQVWQFDRGRGVGMVEGASGR